MTWNKIEEFIFYFLLVAIPFQTRKILFYQGWHFNEWLSVSIYATDVLIFGLFVFWLVSYLKNPVKPKIKNYEYLLIIFIAFTFLSLKNSISWQIGLYRAIKILEFAIFYFYLRSYGFKRFNLFGVAWALIAGGVFQSVVAIIQFLKQGSLGLNYFGESFIGPNISGVAVFINTQGQRVMRAYGTTPHPNVLAGYLLLSILAWYFIFYNSKSNWSLKIIYGLLLWAFFLTFSRVVIGAWVLFFFSGVGYFLFFANTEASQKRKIWRVIIVTLIIMIDFTAVNWSEVISRASLHSSDEAVQLRLEYGKDSLKGGIHWLGVGTGNFVSWLERQNTGLPSSLIQPVHNIFLLIYSENGIFGIGFFIIFIGYILLRARKMSWLLVLFLVIGFFDHFLWTLQQGSLMLWIIVALASNRAIV